MTLISAIITDAFRESNKIAVGTAPTTAMQTEALTLLNRIFASVMGWEVGENLRQWPVGTTGYVEAPAGASSDLWVYPPTNSMLACNLSSAQTIYLPQQPSDGARIGVQDLQGNFATYNLTLNGNGRTIEDAATLTLSTNSLNRSWFFRADLGDWVRFTDLALTDALPFPSEFEDFFVIALAIRLAPRLGPPIGAETLAAYKRSQQQFIARYVQSQPLEVNAGISPFYMSVQSFGNDLLGPDLLSTGV